MSRIPAPMLRAIHDRLPGGNRAPDATGSAESMRERNLDDVLSALAEWSPVRDESGNGDWGQAVLLQCFYTKEHARARRELERHGLSVMRRFEDYEDGPDWLVGRAWSGNSVIDNALATPVIFSKQRQDSHHADALKSLFPIDVVYTWVDGTDEKWRADRSAAQRQTRVDLPTADDEGRFSSHDELRYSLRSIEYFMPWVRRIYIVTAGQTPQWFVGSDDRIRIVDHSEIFALRQNLPTFNSHAIESQIHKIPSLSEHFIYMNDDVFLGRRVFPEMFFTPHGQPKFFLSRECIRDDGPEQLPVDSAAKNNRDVIQERFGRTTRNKFKHTPHAQTLSTLIRIEHEQSCAVRMTAAARFRSVSDLSVPSSLAHYYGLLLGDAIPSAIDYGYVDISVQSAQIQLLRMLSRGLPATFCLNEVRQSPGRKADASRMVRHFLEVAFPFPSSFEPVA